MLLGGCAIYSHDTMVWTFLYDGALNYELKSKESDNSYLYEVTMYEKHPSADDLHSYRTNTLELRIKTVNILLSSKYHTGCSEVEYVSESRYTDYTTRRSGYRGVWWRAEALCHNPKEARQNQYN